MKNRTSIEMVNVLMAIYEESFGGKSRGRYQITRSQFCKLSGRKRLEEVFIQKVINDAFEEGFVITDIGDYFAIVEESVLSSYRPVPKSIGTKYLPDAEPGDDASDDEEEDD